MTVKQIIVGTLAGSTILGLMIHRMDLIKPPVSRHPQHALSAKTPKIALHKTVNHKKRKNTSASELTSSKLY